MSWTVTLERDELDRVTDLVAPCPPVETEAEGVWIRHQGGVRIWECNSWPVVWQLQGARTSTDLAPRCVSSRLIWHALELATKSLSGTVELTVPGPAFAEVRNEVGSGIIDLPRPERRPDIPRFVTPRATAVVTGGDLRDLLDRTRLLPIGAPRDARPATVVGARDGALMTSTSWAAARGLNSTFTVPARVTGDGRSAVSPDALYFLVRHLEADEDVTVTWPADDAVPLLVDGRDFRASVARIPSGAARFGEDVGQALADACGTSVRCVDAWRYEATFRDLPLSVELCDTPSETIRITTTLSDSIRLTPDVYAQVNALNVRLISACAWVTDDGWVMAGTDLPCRAIDELPDRLAEFHTQVSGYGTCLEVLEGSA